MAVKNTRKGLVLLSGMLLSSYQNMSLPESYKTRKYLLYELIGAVIVLVLLIISPLTKGYIRFHWVTDTIWLASIILLTVPELTKDKPPMKYPEWIQPAST